MRHFELLLVPVLMLADYYLTIFGARSRQASGYNERFAIKTYELNPAFRQDVDAKKWFSLRHLAWVVLFTALLAALDWLTSDPEVGGQIGWMVVALIGFLCGVFLTVIGRHIGNLLIFRAFRKHPDSATGRVEMDHGLVLAISGAQVWEAILPLAFVAVVYPSPFTIGAACGPVRLMVAHWQWLAKHRKVSRVVEPTPVEGRAEDAGS